MIDEEVFIPYTTQGAIGALRAKMRVLGERHAEEGTYFAVRARRETLAKLRRDLDLE
jgi:GTP-binding protein HflX